VEHRWIGRIPAINPPFTNSMVRPGGRPNLIIYVTLIVCYYSGRQTLPTLLTIARLRAC